jgi:hypothetical protein
MPHEKIFCGRGRLTNPLVATEHKYYIWLTPKSPLATNMTQLGDIKFHQIMKNSLMGSANYAAYGKQVHVRKMENN